MGFMDFLQGGMQMLGGLFGNGLGVGEEETKEGESESKSKGASPGTKAISSLVGIGSGISGMVKSDKPLSKKDKALGGLNIAENSLDLISNVANIGAGMTKNKTAQKVLGVVSGGANILGGLAGAGKGITDLVTNWNNPEVTTTDRIQSGIGVLGGVGKAFNGATGIGNTLNPDSKSWQKAGKASSFMDSIMGGIGGLFGGGK